MRKNFIFNIILLIGLNLLIKPFWIFGIDRTIQNTVDVQVYGIYYTLFNFSFLFNIILDMGITNFNNRSVARQKDFLKENFSRIFSLKIILFFFYLLFMIAAGFIIWHNQLQIKMLIPLLVNQFLSTFILYLRSNVSGLLMFKTDSFLSVIDRVIMIICCGILLWGNVTDKPFDIMWFIYIQTFSYVVTCLLALSIVLRKTSFQKPFIDMAYCKVILKQSIPFALLHLFTSIHNRVDTVIIERILPVETGAEQVGVYASAFRLLDAGIIIAYLVSVSCMPLFSNMIANKQKVDEILKTSFIILFVYGIVIAVASFFYSQELMNLLYVNHIQESAAVYKILMLSIFPIVLTYVFGSLLTANGNLKQLNIIAILAVCMSLVLNFILVPIYEAKGSAWASLITQMFIIISEIYLAIKLFQFKIKAHFILKLLIFTFGVILLNIASKYLPFLLWQNFSIMLTGAVVIVFISRLIKIKDIVALFSSMK